MKLLKMDEDNKTGKLIFELCILFMILSYLGGLEIQQSMFHNWQVFLDGEIFSQAYIQPAGNNQITYLNQQSIYLSFLSLIFSFLGNKEEIVLILNIILQISGVIFLYSGCRKMFGIGYCFFGTMLAAMGSAGYYLVVWDSSMHMMWFLNLFVYWVCMKILYSEMTNIIAKRAFYVLAGILLGSIVYIDFSGILVMSVIMICILLSDHFDTKVQKVNILLLAISAVISFFVWFYLWNDCRFDSNVWKQWFGDRRSFFGSMYMWKQYLVLTAVFCFIAIGIIICTFKEKMVAVQNKTVLEETKEEVVSETVNKPAIITEMTETDEKKSKDAENEKPKIKFIENPLPLPKKHVKKEMTYAFEPGDDQMHYDLNNYRVDDDYDLKVTL